MEQAYIASDCAIFRFAGKEVLSPADLSARLHQALRDAGAAPWSFAEAEVYTAGGETLVLLLRPKRLLLSLENFEAVLSVLPLCPGDTALFAREEGYGLALDSRTAPELLRDWGELRPLPAEEECHAREQGLCLHENARELLPLFSRPFPTE